MTQHVYVTIIRHKDRVREEIESRIEGGFSLFYVYDIPKGLYVSLTFIK